MSRYLRISNHFKKPLFYHVHYKNVLVFLLSVVYLLAAFPLSAQICVLFKNVKHFFLLLTFLFFVSPVLAQYSDLTINSIYTIAVGETHEVNNLIINADGKLIVEGTLIVNGDITMNFSGNDESELEMLPNSVTIVRGNVHLTNKVSLNLSSYFIIEGNLTKDGATNQGDIVIYEASIYVFGTVDEKSGLDPCDVYDGLTEDNYENCHVGTVNAYEDNVITGTIPPEIIDLVDPCDASATISGGAEICDDGSTSTLTVDLTGTSPWEITVQRDGTNAITVTNISVNPYVFNASEEGLYTIGAISDANCTGTASGGAMVTVNQFNMAVSDGTQEPSGNHCPEFLPPFDASSTSYNPGVTEVVFKVQKNLSSSANWTFDFQVDETGDVEVYDLAIVGNNSAITYTGNDASGSIDADNNTEMTFTFQVWNVPGTALDVDFSVSNGNDGNCDETGMLTDNNINHLINAMPGLGTIE